MSGLELRVELARVASLVAHEDGADGVRTVFRNIEGALERIEVGEARLRGDRLKIVAAEEPEAVPKRRATALKRAGVTAARRELMALLASAGVKLLNPTIVTEAVLRAYVSAEADALTSESGRWSESTRRLAKMNVGEEIVISNSSRSTAHQRTRPARLLMDNPDAKWSMRVVGLDVVVKRLPDGSDIPVRRWSPIVADLASMGIGERKIFAMIKPSPDGCYRLSTYYKNAARKRLGIPEADWACGGTNHGLRVERVA